MPAPDYAAPLEAWRVWRVVEREGELSLASVVRRTVWSAGEPLVARCLRCRPLGDWLRRRPVHAAPEARCECGVYGADLARAGRYLCDELPDARARILGRVALWGTVVECEHGYRASHAYPIVLYVPLDAGRRRGIDAERLAGRLARYGVPVELLAVPRGRLAGLLGE